MRSASRKEILVFRNKDLLSSSTSLTSLKEGVGVRLGDCVEFNVSITERSVSQHHRSHHRSGHAQAQASKPSTTKLLYDAKRVKQLPPGICTILWFRMF